MGAWGGCVQIKREHPGKLIAMQVGDFFEFTGWDAVLAIQVLNLRGMGLSACPPCMSSVSYTHLTLPTKA